MTYSLDFRLHVLSIKEKEGLSFCKLAARVNVGIASLVRWSKKPEAASTRNKPPLKIDREKLKQDVINYPDAYQYERAQRLGVSQTGIWHALKRLKVTYKKNSQTSQSRHRQALCILPKAQNVRGCRTSDCSH